MLKMLVEQNEMLLLFDAKPWMDLMPSLVARAHSIFLWLWL